MFYLLTVADSERSLSETVSFFPACEASPAPFFPFPSFAWGIPFAFAPRFLRLGLRDNIPARTAAPNNSFCRRWLYGSDHWYSEHRVTPMYLFAICGILHPNKASASSLFVIFNIKQITSCHTKSCQSWN